MMCRFKDKITPFLLPKSVALETVGSLRGIGVLTAKTVGKFAFLSA